jgi:cytoskeletal protein RodZ
MPDHNSPHNKTAGEVLKEARESKGLSLITVHESTKIPLDVLKAIEEGYSVRTVSSFYLKGFIKMYAEYLGIDVANVLDRPIPVLEKKKNLEPKIKKVEEKVYRIPDDEFDFNKFIPKDKQRQIVKGIGILIGVFLCVRIVGCLIPKKRKVVEEKPRPVSQQAVSPRAVAEQQLIVKKSAAAAKPAETVQPVVAAAPQSTGEVPVAAQERSDKIRLAVKVLKGGWLQVRVDGNVVVESTLAAGTVKRWEAEHEIAISGRMIHNLEFELNGKMLGTLGRKDRNAHRVIVTKKGLSVSE